MDARASNRTDLFPDLTPYEHGMLPLDPIHTMYWEQSGNPDGVPVLFLHGGPGAGASAAHRRFFDPEHYRIVVFDQRGAGRSAPMAELRDNTTAHLVDDIETLRKHLGVERWIVFGGSWGSSLAIAYGIEHPQRCMGFVLRGIFLGREHELDWFLHGMAKIFPEAWRAFAEFLPADERGDLLGSYYRRLIDPEPDVHLPAAAAWSRYESACSNLIPRALGGVDAASGRAALGISRIEAHYIKHKMFLAPDYLLANVAKLRRHPAAIIQGRYDVVCPIATADELARAWPEAAYVIVPDAGHSAMEPGIRSALVHAMERFKDLG
jgi:proline iminopeptidase